MAKGLEDLRRKTYPERMLDTPHMMLVKAVERFPDVTSALDTTRAILTLIPGSKDKLVHPVTGAILDPTPLVTWGLIQWRKSHRPIYVLDADLAYALANTEPPEDAFDELLRLPFDGLYVAVPPVFTVYNEDTGDHPVEGFFLMNDSGKEDAECRPTHSVTIISVGSAKKGAVVEEGVRRMYESIGREELADELNDALQYSPIYPGENPLKTRFSKEEHNGLRLCTRIAVNLLMALHSTKRITAKKKDPPKLPTSSSKRAKLERNWSTLPYTQLSFTKLTGMGEEEAKEREAKQTIRAEGNERAKVRAHIVPGHWNRYWVTKKKVGPNDKPDGEQTDATTGETLYRVRRWLLPYIRGEGKVEPPTIRVRP